MKKILLVILGLSFSAGFSFAEENAEEKAEPEKKVVKKKLNLKLQPSKKDLDPGSATHLLYVDPKKLQQEEANAAKSGAKITTSCTDQLGMIHKQGDKGYDGCIRTLDKTSSSKQDKQAPSAGFTIGK